MDERDVAERSAVSVEALRSDDKESTPNDRIQRAP